jgi:hypothetical protein
MRLHHICNVHARTRLQSDALSEVCPQEPGRVDSSAVCLVETWSLSGDESSLGRAKCRVGYYIGPSGTAGRSRVPSEALFLSFLAVLPISGAPIHFKTG